MGLAIHLLACLANGESFMVASTDLRSPELILSESDAEDSPFELDVLGMTTEGSMFAFQTWSLQERRQWVQNLQDGLQRGDDARKTLLLAALESGQDASLDNPPFEQAPHTRSSVRIQLIRLLPLCAPQVSVDQSMLLLEGAVYGPEFTAALRNLEDVFPGAYHQLAVERVRELLDAEYLQELVDQGWSEAAITAHCMAGVDVFCFYQAYELWPLLETVAKKYRQVFGLLRVGVAFLPPGDAERFGMKLQEINFARDDSLRPEQLVDESDLRYPGTRNNVLRKILSSPPLRRNAMIKALSSLPVASHTVYSVKGSRMRDARLLQQDPMVHFRYFWDRFEGAKLVLTALEQREVGVSAPCIAETRQALESQIQRCLRGRWHQAPHGYWQLPGR